MGTMSNLQRFAAGEDDTLWTGVQDAVKTMALIEALYESNANGATPIPEWMDDVSGAPKKGPPSK
jgi:hypothetical protein